MTSFTTAGSFALTVIDKWHRECVALQADFALAGQSVVDALEDVATTHELPYAITVDHGTEFTSKALDEWCYRRGVKLDFIRPGKPTENGFIESFNSRLRVLRACWPSAARQPITHSRCSERAGRGARVEGTVNSTYFGLLAEFGEANVPPAAQPHTEPLELALLAIQGQTIDENRVIKDVTIDVAGKKYLLKKGTRVMPNIHAGQARTGLKTHLSSESPVARIL